MIRQAVADDLAPITKIAQAAYQMYIARIGREPAPMVADFQSAIASRTIWVHAKAEVDAFIVLIAKPASLHIENVAVAPAMQGRGLGKALLDFAEHHAGRNGFAKLDLYTNEKMTENLTFYPKLGYVQVARRTENGFNRVYFEKDLQQVKRTS